jgi:hypothetical protein
MVRGAAVVPLDGQEVEQDTLRQLLQRVGARAGLIPGS